MISYVLRIFYKILLVILALVSVTVGGIIFIYYYDTKTTDIAAIYDNYMPVSTKIYDVNGVLIGEIYDQKRSFVPIKYIPKRLINAFLAAEDKNFYDHYGIDFFGIIRAVYQNIYIHITKSRERPVGASTITQQVVKNLVLNDRSVSFARKIKEAILSIKMEHVLTKDQILELYLNQSYIGRGSYGVANAAKMYFNKNLNELTVAESAYIAGLAKGANNYDPDKNMDKAIERRNWVITKMLDNGMINSKEAIKSMREAITCAPSKNIALDCGYCVDEVKSNIVGQYSEQFLSKGGLSIFTTIDVNVQNIVVNALRKELLSYDKRHGWRGAINNMTVPASIEYINTKKTNDNNLEYAVVIAIEKDLVKITLKNNKNAIIKFDNMKWAKKFINANKTGKLITKPEDVLKVGDIIFVEKNGDDYILSQYPKVQGGIIVMDGTTGKIIAMQGGYCFLDSQFNRTTMAMRQPGSIAKLFVYLAAIQVGFKIDDLVDASPITIDTKHSGLWTPKNNKDVVFYEKLSLMDALVRSVNTVTARLITMTGLKNVSILMKNCGLYDKLYKHWSICLGSVETTLFKIVRAVTVLQNSGGMIDPYIIDLVQDRNGEIIYAGGDRKITMSNESIPPKTYANKKNIVSASSAKLIKIAMKEIAKRGTAARATRELKILISGKTGTSNENRDNWFIGFVGDLIIGIYIGYDDNSTLGKEEYGSIGPLNIFIDVVKMMMAAGMIEKDTKGKDAMTKLVEDLS